MTDARRRVLDHRRRNNVIQFRGPVVVWVRRDEGEGLWIVSVKSFGWLHANQHEAIRDARYIAHTYGVRVRVSS
jgi:hypothetical protein